MSLSVSQGTSRGMRRWYARMPKCGVCRSKFLVLTEAHNRGYCQGCFKKAVQIEDGEWYCAGCFIQKSEHPALVGGYEVFKDNQEQTNVGRYDTLAAAKKAARLNQVITPLRGLMSFL